MTESEIKKLKEKGESIHLEFKTAERSVPPSLYETICSFLNKEGGTILLGVTDDGIIQGVDSSSLDQIVSDITTALNNRDLIDPPVNLPVNKANYKDQSILYLKIPVSSQVHKYKGFIYDRENDSDFRITDGQRISEIYFRKRQGFTENQIYPHLSLKDLDEELFSKARNLIRSINSTHPWLSVDNERMLRDSLLYRKDFSNGQEGLTLAAALIFGKNKTIGNILPAYKVDAMVRRENTDRWDDRIPLRTNLIDTYLQLMEFAKKHLPEKFFLEGDQRIDLRDRIIREVVANMIVHREVY